MGFIGQSTSPIYQGRIVAVHSSAPTGQPADPAEVTYDVEAVNTPDQVSLTGVTPAGRVAAGAEIIPARVDDLCWMALMPDGSWRVYVYETIDFSDCQP